MGRVGVSTAAGLLLTAVLALLAWRVLTLGLADHFAASDPARSMAWRPGHPEAAIALAEQAAARDAKGEASARLARSALRSDPLDGRGYRLLAQQADAAGHKAEAARLYFLAAATSPRDIPSQVWLANHFLAKGNAGRAMAHMDFLMKSSPQTTASLYPALLAMAATPAAHPALVERLVAQPRWRTGVMAYLLRNASQLDSLALLVETLRKSPGGLSEGERDLWLTRLTQEERWGKAYLTWVSQLPPEKLSGLRSIHNGGFEDVPDESVFDWHFRHVPGALIERVAGEGVSGQKALRIRFADRRVPFNHVRQLLALAPGPYVLRWRARPEGLLAVKGLSWSLDCAGKGRRILLETEPLRGDGPWQEFSAYFQVPEEGCGGQWLSLKLSAKGAGEQHVAGTAWFDDVRVTRP